MNYVVDFYYKQYVVYCKTLEEVKTTLKIHNYAPHILFITTENKTSGTELAEWFWQLEIKDFKHKIKIVPIERY